MAGVETEVCFHLPQKMALDIIVVNYNSGPHLTNCLESLFRQKNALVFGITVVDNGSGDGSLEQARRRYPDIRYLRNPCNRGFAAGVNQALEQGRAEYALLVNPDVVVLPGAPQRMLDFMERTPRCGVLGGEILDKVGRYQPTARRFPTYFNMIFGRRSLLRRFLPNNPGSRRYLYLDLDRQRPQKVDFLEGSLLMLRRRALVETGRFDEDFFLYLEDADLCRRMAERDWETWWLPKAYAIHFRGETYRRDNIRPMRHHSRSIYQYFLKHQHPPALLRLGLNTLLWIRYAYILGTEFAKKEFLCS